MNRNQFAMVCTLGLAVCCPGMAGADGPVRDLSAEVRAVFRAKCARCHGPELAKPKSGFGYVLDLRRLAADPDKIVPHNPDESGLWQQIHNDEMPPPNSPSGQLTAQQKEVIRAWITAGAPAESSTPAKDTVTPLPEEVNAPPPSLVWRALAGLGKFHLLLVHFPIALLVAAMAGELWSVWKRTRVPSPAVRFCLGLAAVSAVLAVALGWLFALAGHGAGELLLLHRLFGTTAGAGAVVIAGFSEVDARRGVRRWTTRVLLLAGVLLVSITAHFGGLMVHGKDFFDW